MNKYLEIGNFPPPYCGWAIQTKFLVEHLRKIGHICKVLKINEGRRAKSSEYVDVQGAFDYSWKLLLFAARGYRFHAHVNAESLKGYCLALAAGFIGRLFRLQPVLTFHGGLPQSYFPRQDAFSRCAFQILFRLYKAILCNSEAIKAAIVEYDIAPEKVTCIPGFSPQYIQWQSTSVPFEAEDFLRFHRPVFFCYVSFRPEYRLEILCDVIEKFSRLHPDAGFILLGFPEKELASVRVEAKAWPKSVRNSLLLLGNLNHNEFLTLLSRCSAMIRTPACDGISASVLEALALGIPVLASDNGRRPEGVVTYSELDADDLLQKLLSISDMKENASPMPISSGVDNVAATADWLTGATTRLPERSAAKAP
jgi:glycosyltransferase involved in cell wall biosynthesis